MKDKNNTQDIVRLQQTVRFFEALLRASADSIVITDPSKNIIFANDTFCKIFSRKRQDVIETNLFVWLEKLNPNAMDIWTGLENQVNELNVARDVEFSMKAGKGMRYFSVNSSLLEKADIEETGLIISIWHDITKRKMAEEALKRAHDELEMRVQERTAQLSESEQKYRRIFEYSNDIIVQVDRYGKVLAVNDKLEDVFGYRPEEVIGKYFFNIGVWRFKDLPRIITLFKNTVKKGMTRDKSGKLLEKVDIELRDKKGNFVFVETNTTVLKKDGKIEGFLTSIRDITESKQAKELLKASEEKYSTLVEKGNDGIIILQDDLLKYVNSKICEMTGFTREEIIGKPFLPHASEEYKALVRERYEKRLRGDNIPSVYEIEIVSKNGLKIPFEINASLIEYEGRPASMAILRDISQRKQMEEALQESSSLIVNAFNNSPLLMTISDITTGKYLDVNDTFCHVSGFSRDEAIGKTSIELGWIRKEERTRMVQGLEHDGKVTGLELPLTCKDGKKIICRYSGDIIQTSKGNKLFSAAEDITEYKRAEEALRKREHEYHTILQTALDGFWVLDLQGHFIDINEAYCKIIGYSREELLGMTLRDVEFFETESQTRQHIKNIIDNGYAFFETRHRRKDGRIVDIEASVNYLKNESKLFVFLRDITQRKKAEEALRASLEEKTVLLHEVHHRVKNNLQIVSSLLNLQATRIKNREAKEALRETANRIQSMAMLHETLNISGNLSTVNFSPYIKNICGHIISSYGPKAENIKLENKIANILIDLDQAVPCGLIINELVSNALKHAFPEGRKGLIIVELKALPDNHIMLTVADDGIGLPPGLDIAQTETLGLKLVTILTEKLNGSVKIIRDPGTTFHIMFKGKMNKKSEGQLIK